MALCDAFTSDPNMFMDKWLCGTIKWLTTDKGLLKSHGNHLAKLGSDIGPSHETYGR